MHVSWVFTGDGLLAFAGGALALFGVWWNNHQSVKNLGKQLEAERNERAQEAERKKRAVAAALLSEIDSFYASHLERRHELLEHWKKVKEDPQLVEVFRSIAGNPFAVYESVADGLGGFDAVVARGIVITYGLMANYDDFLKRYEREMSDTSSRTPAAQALHSQIREGMRNSIREVGELAVQSVVMMCRALCVLTGTDFSSLFVAKESGGPEDLARKLPWFVPGTGSANAKKN